MNKHIRLVLLIASGVFFVLAATTVVLYAVGYRFVPSAQQPVSVGVLLLETIPKGISVFINGTLVGTTPEAVAGLLQGDVHVRLEKEGYASWEKHLPIIATRATEVRTAKLFANDALVDTIAENVHSYALSPNRQLIAVVDIENRLHIVTPQGQPAQAPTPLTGTPTSVLWSPDSSAVLLRIKSAYFVASSNTGTTPREITALRNSNQVVWDPRLPGRVLGITPNADLISVSVATGAIQALAENIRLFAPTSRGIVIVNSPNTLTRLSFQGGVQEQRELPDVTRIESLTATPTGNVAIEDSDGSVRILTRQGELLDIAPQGHAIGWSSDGTMLLLQSSRSELAIVNVENERATYLPIEEAHTIVRVGRPISYPQWFAGDTHVVFQMDDEVVLSEVDTRDRAIQFTVDATNTGDAQAMVGEDGFSMFYVKSGTKGMSLVNRPLVLAEDQ